MRISFYREIIFLFVLASGSTLFFTANALATGLKTAMKNYEKGKNEIVKNIGEVKKSPCNTMILSTKIGLIEGALNRHVSRVKDTVEELEANIQSVSKKFMGDGITSCSGVASVFEKGMVKPVAVAVGAATEKLQTYKNNFVKDSGQVKSQKDAISAALGKPECASAKSAFQNGMNQTEALPKKMDVLIAAVEAQKAYPQIFLKDIHSKLKCN